MNKLIGILSFMMCFSITVNAQFISRLSLGISAGTGYDLQTRSNDFNVTGPLVIPSSIESSILRIENPTQLNLSFSYELNPNMRIFTSFGRTERSMKYWSMDSSGSETNCTNCKAALTIKQNNVFTGIEFRSNLKGRTNFYFKPSLGVSWIKSSPFYSINSDDEQAEVLELHDGAEEVLLHVHSYEGRTIGSLNTAFGVDYRINKVMSLQFEMSFNNEFSNESRLHIHQYDSETNSTGGYSPFDMEFKTLYTSIGVRFDL